MREFVSDVTCRYEPICSNLSLNPKIPLLHIRDMCVRIECVVDAIRRIRHVLVQNEREWFTSEITIWIVQPACRIICDNLSSPRRPLSGCQIQFNGVDIVENSVARADHHLAVIRRVPNKPGAGCKMLPLLVHSGVAVGAEQGVAWIEHAGWSVHKHIALDSIQK